jgi:predicted DNA-binding ribbon-helix-helix protein
VNKEARLHMRLSPDLFSQVKEIARRRGVTVTHLVDQFFRELVDQENRPKTEEELGVEQA